MRAPPATNLSQVMNFLGPEPARNRSSETEERLTIRVFQFLPKLFSVEDIKTAFSESLPQQNCLISLGLSPNCVLMMN